MAVVAVPVKRLAQAKQRLSRLCTSQERAALSLAFLRDLLRKLTTCALFDEVVVIGNDPCLNLLLADYSIRVIADERDRSLNSAFLLASENLSQGEQLLFLHSDLPLIREEDLDVALSRLTGSRAVFCADKTGTGTNAVAAIAPIVFPSCFGKDSLGLHLEACDSLGIPRCAVYNERMAFDVDTPEDIVPLIDLLNPQSEPETYAVIRRLACLL